MPRVTIKKRDLPAVSENGVYTIRIRIVSDDKNSTSYWTPIYNLMIPDENGKFVKNAMYASVYHTRIGQGSPQNFNIHASWHDPNDLGLYDVYTNWHIPETGWTGWEHMETVSVRNFTFNPPLYKSPQAGFDKYGVAVTRSNFNRRYNPDLALFSTPLDGLDLV